MFFMVALDLLLFYFALMMSPCTIVCCSHTQGDWPLPGQKTLGSMTAGADCTNATMFGWAHKNFPPEEGGLYAIGMDCTFAKSTRANVQI